MNVLLKKQCDTDKDNILVVSAAGLSHGVTGIVASQMVKLYGKPVILFIEDKEKGEATGACRSIDGFDIVSALDKTKDLLDKNIDDIDININETDEYIEINVSKTRKSLYSIISNNTDINITYKGIKEDKKIIKG